MKTENLVLEFCKNYMGHCLVDYTALFSLIEKWDVSFENNKCRCEGWKGSNLAFKFIVYFDEKRYQMNLYFDEIQYHQTKNSKGVVIFAQMIFQENLYTKTFGFMRNSVPIITSYECAAGNNKQVKVGVITDEHNYIKDYKLIDKIYS